MRSVVQLVFRARTVILSCAILALLSSAWAQQMARSSGIFRPFYTEKVLVSDGSTTAPRTDPNLVKPWGLAFGPEFAWVADNGAGVASLYDGKGRPQILVVGIPSAPGSETIAKPTGVVFNTTRDFSVTSGTRTKASRFLFATEDGSIAALCPEISPNEAILEVNSSSAVYTAIAIATRETWKPRRRENLLYAADFHNAKIDIFDRKFHPVQIRNAFVDPSIPAGYAPYGIQNIGGLLYVAYAQQDATQQDSVSGAGLGLIRIFDSQGRLLRKLVSGNGLNAPWGMALAPRPFGDYPYRLLVSNHGDGTISVFDAVTGRYDGQLQDSVGNVLTIDGLRGIAFGNGRSASDNKSLFFTASPQDTGGLFGKIDVAWQKIQPKPKPKPLPGKKH